ncbi:MAG: PLD nuclease N-terminal domain-containing protein [Actinomycetes bacterium]
MAIGDGLVALLVLGFWIFCLFDVITTDESLMRNLSKTWWIVIVLFFSVVGSIMWLVAGRPQGQAGAGMPYRGNRGESGTRFGPPPGAQGGGGLVGAAPRRAAPDDDPEFLESVRKQNAEDKDLLRRWEDDLRRREEQLRNRPDDDPNGPDGTGGGKPQGG